MNFIFLIITIIIKAVYSQGMFRRTSIDTSNRVIAENIYLGKLAYMHAFGEVLIHSEKSPC